MRITPLTNLSGTKPTAKLQKNLVLWHIIIIGLAYIQPLTLFDTFGLVSEQVVVMYLLLISLPCCNFIDVDQLWTHDQTLSFFRISIYLRPKVNSP